MAVVPYARRAFFGGATATTLAAPMTPSDVSFTIVNATGWPGAPGVNFLVVIDRDTISEEKIMCTQNSGTAVTVLASGGRGADTNGASATSHATGAVVEVCIGALDGDEANQLVSQTFGQSGAAKGDLWYVNSPTSPATLTRLPVGVAGQQLNSVGGVPTWTYQSLAVFSTTSIGAAAINTSYTISAAGTANVNLPAASGNGWIEVFNASGNTLTITAHGTDTIQGLGFVSQAIININAAGASARLEIGGTGGWIVTAGAQESGKIVPPFVNSWAGTNAFYRRTANVVRLYGVLTTGTSATTAFTLPTGFRPPVTTGYSVWNPVNASTTGQLTISSAGVVVPTGNVGFGISIDGITFTID